MSSIRWRPLSTSSRKSCDAIRQLVQPVEDEVDLVGRKRPADLRELERDQGQQRHLRGERLRRRDADLEAAARVDRGLRLARDLRPHEIRDRERPRALLARELHRVDRVARLARLRDADHERVLRQHRVAVDPLARDVGLDGDACPLLDDVPADDAGVVRRPARDDDDAAEILDLHLAHAQRLEHEVVAAHAVADRLAHRLRLLVDLLEHERLVAALLRDLLVVRDLLGLTLDLGAVDEEACAGRRELDHLAVDGEVRTPRLREERGDRRGDEHLAVADADDERRLAPDAGEQVGMVVVDGDDREVALELRIDAHERLGEVAVVLALEQVHDHLGVRLRAERRAPLPAAAPSARGSSPRCR